MMKRIGRCLATLLTLSASLSLPTYAQSNLIEPEAMATLNKMGAYLRTLKSFQVHAEVTTEDVLNDGQKVQYSSKTSILADMPNHLMADVDGDLKSRVFFYDGKSFTIHMRRAGYYATVPAPPTISQLVDVALDKYEIDIPLLDLFLWGGPKAATSAITSATDIGLSQVGGVSCEHYAFRQPGLDWQIWIQKGDFPLPRKLVITTLTDEARPQQVSVYNWNLAPAFNLAAFTFDPPTGVGRIQLEEAKAAGNK